MEEQTNNTSPQADTQDASATQPHPKKKEGAGAFAGVVIIVIVLILGGVYFWGTQLNNQKQQSAEKTLLNSAVNTNIATPQDAPAKIQADLNKFDSKAFDAKLNADLNAVNTAL